MQYFKKTNIFKHILFSRGTIVVLFFMIVFSSLALYSIIVKSIDASNQRKISETEVSELKTKEADLKRKIELLKTPEGQSEALKEQYPVVATGEHLVVITDDVNSSSSDVSQIQPTQKNSFWNYIKNLFK